MPSYSRASKCCLYAKAHWIPSTTAQSRMMNPPSTPCQIMTRTGSLYNQDAQFLGTKSVSIAVQSHVHARRHPNMTKRRRLTPPFCPTTGPSHFRIALTHTPHHDPPIQYPSHHILPRLAVSRALSFCKHTIYFYYTENSPKFSGNTPRRLCSVVVITPDFDLNRTFRQPRFEPGHDLELFFCSVIELGFLTMGLGGGVGRPKFRAWSNLLEHRAQ
ncbi:hypothetical protein K458DRAFT_106199 [Lentithecium fluviatile CBS 122367]|uniref:Uncharacterized protein n=1 Tax=Lentithecium fluviatile CBS 122367 TaxID=1168545 RepID=A0A6G1JJ77_9PLEO|nr:hypothetical protein K458DRAFT_106199 [Lentithecium fluviatile CBS 122367]